MRFDEWWIKLPDLSSSAQMDVKFWKREGTRTDSDLLDAELKLDRARAGRVKAQLEAHTLLLAPKVSGKNRKKFNMHGMRKLIEGLNFL